VAEDNATRDEPPSGGKSQTPIMILLVVVCLMMAANLFVSMRKGGGGPAKEEEKKAEGEPKETFPWEMEEAKKYQTADGVAELQMEVEFLKKETADKVEVGRLQDALIQFFGSKTGELKADDAQLREDLRLALEGVFGENTVYRVNFLQFLYQSLPSR